MSKVKYQIQVLGLWVTVSEKTFYKCNRVFRKMSLNKEKNK